MGACATQQQDALNSVMVTCQQAANDARRPTGSSSKSGRSGCSAAFPRGTLPLSPADVAGRCSSNAEGISSNERGWCEEDPEARLLPRLFIPGRKGPELRCGISPKAESAQARSRRERETRSVCPSVVAVASRPCGCGLEPDLRDTVPPNWPHLRRSEPDQGACLFLHTCAGFGKVRVFGVTVHVAAREGGSELREVAMHHDPRPAGEDVTHAAVLSCRRGEGWRR